MENVRMENVRITFSINWNQLELLFWKMLEKILELENVRKLRFGKCQNNNGCGESQKSITQYWKMLENPIWNMLEK